MDAITLTVAAGAYVAAALAKRVVDVPLDKAINTAFERIVSTMWAKLGHKPLPEDFNTSVVRSVDLKQNPVLINDVDSIFKTSSALRRARLVEQVLRNARLLWVDDVPDNIIYEVQVSESLRCRDRDCTLDGRSHGHDREAPIRFGRLRYGPPRAA